MGIWFSEVFTRRYVREVSLVIFIADDSKGVRDFITEVLESGGHEVTAFEDGRPLIEALRRLESLPDLVIADGQMLNVDGPEVIEEMKADTHLAGVPIILCSGNMDLAEYAKEKGIHYVYKGEVEPNLMETINKIRKS